MEIEGMSVKNEKAIHAPQSDRTILTIDLLPPAESSGQRLVGALIANGWVVATGETRVAHDGHTLLHLFATDSATDSGPDFPIHQCQLHLCIDRDESGSAFAGFGDLQLVTQVNPDACKGRCTLLSPSGWRERKLSDPRNRLKIHYHRFDRNYLQTTLWSWDVSGCRNPSDQDLLPIGSDDFGLIFEVDLAEYGNGEASSIGFIGRLHRDWEHRDGPDRVWSPTLGHALYMVAGRKELLSEPPDIRPHILGAWLDDRSRIVVEISHPIPHREEDLKILQILDPRNQPIPLASVHFADQNPAQSPRIEVTTVTHVGPSGHGFKVTLQGFGGSVPVRPRGVLRDAELFANPNTIMGASYATESTVFRVFAPTAESASVILYAGAQGTEGRTTQAMTPEGRGIWKAAVHGDLEGRFYMLQFTGDGFEPGAEAVDIYATNTVESSKRARITDFKKANPPGEAAPGPRLSDPVDMVVYELHVRDFSICPDSGARHRGLYLAFTEAGTHLPNDPATSTCLDHLVELGVTHVQLLPVQDHDNDESEQRYDWGYMTQNFNSPEGMYASRTDDESRVREMKLLVKALHERGIGVILDVVYNHTAPFAPFNSLVPGYYYRVHPDGAYSNGSGCGNEFSTEAPMGRKYLVETLCHWLVEYGVDGFRFDLMALLDAEAIHEVESALRRIRPDIVLYGEPWMADRALVSRACDKEALRHMGVGAFNDDYRNALKGSPEGDGVGFIQNGHHREQVEQGIAGSRNAWASRPSQTVNYMTCHDNLVLFDKLRRCSPHATDTELIDTMKLGYLLLLTSQGVPFLHGGEEFARTKGGNHNSYNAPDSVNQIDWILKRTHRHLFEYVRALVALRKAHPIFRLRTYEEIDARLHFHHTPRHESILFTIEGHGLAGESWQRVCVAVNSLDREGLDFPLPPGRWNVSLQADGQPGETEVEGIVHARAKSGLILNQ